MTPYSTVGGYQRFTDPQCLQLRHEDPTTILYRVTTRKTSTWNIIAEKASKLATFLF